jgi:hypothetical protein
MKSKSVIRVFSINPDMSHSLVKKVKRVVYTYPAAAGYCVRYNNLKDCVVYPSLYVKGSFDLYLQ